MSSVQHLHVKLTLLRDSIASLAILGLSMLLVYSILWELYWDESTPDCVLPEPLWIFIVIGFPLALIPPLLINWRIVCLYVTTYDITGQRVSPMHQRNRGTAWLLIRYVRIYV